MRIPSTTNGQTVDNIALISEVYQFDICSLIDDGRN